MREMSRGVNLVKIYCKLIREYHNIFPLYSYYMLTKRSMSKMKEGREEGKMEGRKGEREGDESPSHGS
jgi:hypothetical protein